MRLSIKITEVAVINLAAACRLVFFLEKCAVVLSLFASSLVQTNLTGNTTKMRHIKKMRPVWETGVSRYHRGLFKDPLETPQTSYGTMVSRGLRESLIRTLLCRETPDVFFSCLSSEASIAYITVQCLPIHFCRYI